MLILLGVRQCLMFAVAMASEVKISLSAPGFVSSVVFLFS